MLSSCITYEWFNIVRLLINLFKIVFVYNQNLFLINQASRVYQNVKCVKIKWNFRLYP